MKSPKSPSVTGPAGLPVIGPVTTGRAALYFEVRDKYKSATTLKVVDCFDFHCLLSRCYHWCIDMSTGKASLSLVNITDPFILSRTQTAALLYYIRELSRTGWGRDPGPKFFALPIVAQLLQEHEDTLP